jgi:hypothetical protein
VTQLKLRQEISGAWQEGLKSEQITFRLNSSHRTTQKYIRYRDGPSKRSHKKCSPVATGGWTNGAPLPAAARTFYCSEANPASNSTGVRGSLPGLNRPEGEVNHSSPSTAEICSTLKKGQKAHHNSSKTNSQKLNERHTSKCLSLPSDNTTSSVPPSVSECLVIFTRLASQALFSQFSTLHKPLQCIQHH